MIREKIANLSRLGTRLPSKVNKYVNAYHCVHGCAALTRNHAFDTKAFGKLDMAGRSENHG